MPTTLLIARHGDVEGISPERFRGHQDVPLTLLGDRQAGKLARALADSPPVKIFTSPLVRCKMTAQAVSDLCGTEPKIVDWLEDIDYGDWQWKTVEEAQRESPKMLELWYSAPHAVRFPNGESLQDVAVRAADALRFAKSFQREERILYVSHDTVIRVLLLQLLGAPLSSYWRLAQGPCCINEVTIRGDGWRVERVNDTAHLE